MDRDINWIWPLHELKYGMWKRNGSEKGKRKGKKERNTDVYCFCIKAFHFSSGCPLALSPFLPSPHEMEEPGMKVPGAERTEGKDSKKLKAN